MLLDQNKDRFQEECGVFGIHKGDYTNLPDIFYGALTSLQHRGEESSGVTCITEKGMITKKALGLVSNLFSKKDVLKIQYSSAIGHVRYSTCGEVSLRNAQPIQDISIKNNIALAHNGNLLNKSDIKEKLEKEGLKFAATTDSEVILKFLIKELNNKKSLEQGVVKAIKELKGAFSVLVLTENKLIGFRDEKGIRPLVLGKVGENYVLSSETAAITSVGGHFIRDVGAGEIVIIDKWGLKSIETTKNKSNICALEYIYFSRPDSFIENINVCDFRMKCGQMLYKSYEKQGDIVIGVPDSGLLAALGYSKASNIPYEIGIIKNPYAGRNFIKPTEKKREKNINVKLNIIKPVVRNKKVIVIDDSIIRGTSSKRIVYELKKAGALEVHFKVASPRVDFNCNLGIDIKNTKELLSSNKSLEDMRKFIGADSLEFLSLDAMKKCLKDVNICTGCFNGIYADN